ncbi:hypothetical protein K8O61_10020 [Xanthomonas cerealis pv. cerealis]|uniref:hypothetical protein n=1 Tax=Xanthomonas cerealis TaxID=3390025 RepID=UPI001F1CB042|nr:hypothetical protein [Xanthomonas translucens]UKE67883.1 hypothetical protein K8O61_10020 [Xanthomonas translucens pv. pistacia]
MSAGSQQPIAALRLYFPISSKAGATRLWHRLAAPALAGHLLGVARQARIVQAVLYQVSHGYLP